MLISHRKKFIFIKTVKTASTSVEAYFEPYCMRKGEWSLSHARDEYVSDTGIVGYRGPPSRKGNAQWWNHIPASDIRINIGSVLWDEYFKFCVVRNPFEKIVSRYYFVKFRSKEGKINSLLNTVKNSSLVGLGGAIEPSLQAINFRKWLYSVILSEKCNKFRRLLTLDRFYTIDGDICVDYFIRYEKLLEGIEHVCSVLDIPFEPERLPTFKSGIRPTNIPLADYYDKETINLVSRFFKKEIDMFGYEPPSL